MAANRPAGVYQLYRETANYVSPDGRTVQFSTGLRYDPGSTAAMNEIPAIRTATTSIQKSVDATASGVAGEAPALKDISDISTSDLKHIIPVAILAIGILLALVLRKALERRLPAIVHWEGVHWLIVYRVDGGKVRLADPARGLRTVSRAEVEENWSGFAALASPTEALALALHVLAQEPPEVSLSHMALRFPPVSQFLERFRALLRRRSRFDFETEVGEMTRLEQASAFLALLELRRSGELAIEQAAPFAPIRVNRLAQETNAPEERTAAWTARSA